MAEHPKVLYILGSGRTGSTILGQVLDASEGVFFAGELVDFWVRGVVENRLCGCGERAHDCDVWGPIIGHIRAETTDRKLREMARLRTDASTLERFLRSGSPAFPRLPYRNSNLFNEMVGKLLHLIVRTTGCSLIVDSSKFTDYAAELDSMNNVDLYWLHLLRDPRAVAHSWARFKIIPDPDEELAVPRFGTLGSTLRWVSRNLSASHLVGQSGSPSVLLRYEDFISDPGRELARIQESLGFLDAGVELLYRSGQALPRSHAIWGNPIRFDCGEIPLTLDQAWRTEQSKVKGWLIKALTAPWRNRYGYP